MDMLKEKGYPVYGANGKIGFYDEYTHEIPTLMISCRGAGCGSMHISEPFSYINGNAMALDQMSEDFDLKFLYYYFHFIGFTKVISGSAQPQITREGLSSVEVPMVEKKRQQKIAAILDEADTLRRKDKALLAKYDELLQAVFYDMFYNDEHKTVPAREVLKVVGGAAFKSEDYAEHGEGIPLIRIGTINKGYFDGNSLVFLPSSHEATFRNYVVSPKDLLITLTGTVGKEDYGNIFELTSLYPKYFLNQRVAKLQYDGAKLHTKYLLHLFKQPSIKNELIGISRGVRQANISNEDIYSLNIPMPSMELQKKFELIAENLETQKSQILQQQTYSENLFQSLMQRAFKGELVG